MSRNKILPGGEGPAFDQGVRQGADYLAIVQWANYEEKSAVYITAPYRTNDVIEAAAADEDGGVVEIYNLHLDRDYQLQSPYRQWNTEAGPSEPERAMIEDYYKDYPPAHAAAALSEKYTLRLPEPTPAPHPSVPAVHPGDPVAALHASAREIHDRHLNPPQSDLDAAAVRKMLATSFPGEASAAVREKLEAGITSLLADTRRTHQLREASGQAAERDR